MPTNQPELRPQGREMPEDDPDELYEEEPRSRAWGAIASVVLALALVFVGYQWNQAATRAETLGAQINGLRAESETQRMRAEDAQRQLDAVQKRLAAVSAEKDTLTERVASLEKSSVTRPAAVRAEKPRATTKVTGTPGRPRATPVATRPAPKRAP